MFDDNDPDSVDTNLIEPRTQKIDRIGDEGGEEKNFTEVELKKAEWAQKFPWDQRPVPEEYNAVQLDNSDGVRASFLDWWNTRSKILCCFFPCVQCYTGSKVIDATDTEVWKEQLKHSNPDTPESMKGLWWLKDNIAHENLVTIFNDAKFVGTFNKEGTDGYGYWERDLYENWSRDQSCFGLILIAAAKKKRNTVSGMMNMKDGICTTIGGGKTQIVYRIDDDEWWKVHYVKKDDGEENINYMYKWVKVLDKDGNKTKHWATWEAWSTSPLPNRNCGTSWFPCWPSCLDHKELFEDMVRPNKRQAVVYYNRSKK